MKITILLIGTRGDVQPYVALGKGLQQKGYAVKIAAPLNFKSFIENQALEYAPIRVNLKELMASSQASDFLNKGKNPLKFFKNFKKITDPLVQMAFDDLWAAAQGSDALIYSIMTFPAHFMAKDLGIPAFGSCLQPLVKTSTFPSPILPIAQKWNKTINRWSHQTVYQLYWLFTKSAIQKWRARHGLSPVSSHHPFKEIMNGELPFLCGISDFVLPKPNDWTNNIHNTGYWYLNQNTEWQPPKALEHFLNNGEKPICIGFGSMNDKNIHRMYEEAVEIADKQKVRAILLTGWSSQKAGLETNENIYVAEAMPHSWLLPKVKAVVHHGGAGTSAAAMKAGIPSIIVPFFFDQHFWSWQMKKMGVATKPLFRKKFNAQRFEKVLLEALHNEELKAKAEKIGQLIRNEDGVAKAIQILENFLPNQPKHHYETHFKYSTDAR